MCTRSDACAYVSGVSVHVYLESVVRVCVVLCVCRLYIQQCGCMMRVIVLSMSVGAATQVGVRVRVHIHEKHRIA